MNHKIIQIFFKIQVLLLAVLLAAACTDDAWDQHYQANPEIVSSQNLWQTIDSIPELSSFASVLKKYGYDKFLSQTQAFTVFAPDNDAMALLDTTNMDVEKELIKNHIARFILPASGSSSNIIATLNGKRIVLQYNDGKYYYGNAIFASSISSLVASNGIVHVLNSYEQFFPNIWEYIGKTAGLDSIRKYLYSFDELIFNEEASVPGSIVNGQQTYLDSVMINYNMLLSKLGNINSEDSSYTMIVPDNAAWTEAYNRIKDYFVYYDSDKRVADSLQRINTSYALVQDLIYSNKTQKSTKDSITSTSDHTFYNPQTLLDGTKITTSNGAAYITSLLKIDALDSWHVQLKTEAERTVGRVNTLSTTYTLRSPAGVSNISAGRYLKLEPTTSSGNPTVTFDIHDNLSNFYDVYCVFVGQKLVNANATGVKDTCKVYFNLNYMEQDGSTVVKRCPASGVIKTNPSKLDTVLVASGFKFPVANYGEEDANVTLKVISNVSRSETTNYSRELLIDCILLKPGKQ